MVPLRRFQKCLACAVATLLLTVVCCLVHHLTDNGPAPGSIIPSANFRLSKATRTATPLIMITYPGRMGNHMFQYATLMGVAKRNNMRPIIPSTIDLLDIFKIPTQQGDIDLLDGQYYIYKEEKAAGYFNATEKLKPFNTLLHGYYQSWKYFNNVHASLMSRHFVFKDEIESETSQYLKHILLEKKKHGAVLVGVHVRRGDFVRQRMKGYTAAPLSYFYRAMNYFRRKFKHVLFIVCSNDVLWAEDNLDIGPDVYYSKHSDGRVDFALLTRCKHMVITAGSYSWWAGYMVTGDVIYFKGFPKPNTVIGNITVREDYYPPHWIPM